MLQNPDGSINAAVFDAYRGGAADSLNNGLFMERLSNNRHEPNPMKWRKLDGSSDVGLVDDIVGTEGAMVVEEVITNRQHAMNQFQEGARRGLITPGIGAAMDLVFGDNHGFFQGIKDRVLEKLGTTEGIRNEDVLKAAKAAIEETGTEIVSGADIGKAADAGGVSPDIIAAEVGRLSSEQFIGTVFQSLGLDDPPEEVAAVVDEAMNATSPISEMLAKAVEEEERVTDGPTASSIAQRVLPELGSQPSIVELASSDEIGRASQEIARVGEQKTRLTTGFPTLGGGRSPIPFIALPPNESRLGNNVVQGIQDFFEPPEGRGPHPTAADVMPGRGPK
jgi:hypothetical protein